MIEWCAPPRPGTDSICSKSHLTRAVGPPALAPGVTGGVPGKSQLYGKPRMSRYVENSVM